MFFVLLAVILYYSFGYKYDIDDGKTVQVGAVIVKTEPRKSDIYLNEKLFKNGILGNLFNDYIKIENLNPETYNVKIRKDNHFTWEKNISVEGGYITKFKNVVLLKNSYEEIILLKDLAIDLSLKLNEKNIWVNNRKSKIAYQKINKGKLNIFIFDPRDKKEELITNRILPPKEYGDYYFDNIIWSENDTKIIFKVSSINDNSKYSWCLIDFENNNKTYKLDSILKQKKEIANKQDFYFGESLFYLENNALYKFNYDKLVSKKILENVASFSIIGNDIYYFKIDDKNLYSANYTKLNGIKNILIMPDNFNSNLPSKIIKSNKNSYLVLSKSGNLYFVNENNKIIFINSFIENAHFSNGDKRIIYNNDHEIWIYYIYEKISQPSKKEHTNELITRYSGEISNIFLYKDNEHLFYKEGKVFKFIELDNRDKVNVFNILELENDDILYSRDDNSIYYLKNNKLVQIELMAN